MDRPVHSSVALDSGLSASVHTSRSRVGMSKDLLLASKPYEVPQDLTETRPLLCNGPGDLTTTGLVVPPIVLWVGTSFHDFWVWNPRHIGEPCEGDSLKITRASQVLAQDRAGGFESSRAWPSSNPARRFCPFLCPPTTPVLSIPPAAHRKISFARPLVHTFF